jgi:hypothetical protein
MGAFLLHAAAGTAATPVGGVRDELLHVAIDKTLAELGAAAA